MNWKDPVVLGMKKVGGKDPVIRGFGLLICTIIIVMSLQWLCLKPKANTSQDRLQEAARSRVARISFELFQGGGARKEKFFVRTIRTSDEIPGMQQVFLRREPQMYGGGHSNEFSFWVPSTVTLTEGEEVIPFRVWYVQADQNILGEHFYTLRKK